jgi:hypothetical protein
MSAARAVRCRCPPGNAPLRTTAVANAATSRGLGSMLVARIGARKEHSCGTQTVEIPGSRTATGLLQGYRSGASRDRTGDLLLAKQALSQLSYGPERAECTGGAGRSIRPPEKRGGRAPRPRGARPRAWTPPVPQHKAPQPDSVQCSARLRRTSAPSRGPWTPPPPATSRAFRRTRRRRRRPRGRARRPRTAGGSGVPSPPPARSRAGARRRARGGRP